MAGTTIRRRAFGHPLSECLAALDLNERMISWGFHRGRVMGANHEQSGEWSHNPSLAVLLPAINTDWQEIKVMFDIDGLVRRAEDFERLENAHTLFAAAWTAGYRENRPRFTGGA